MSRTTTPKLCQTLNCQTDHMIHLQEGETMLTLVGTGKRAYLHVRFRADGATASVGIGNGRTLRLLANAILRGQR